MEGFIRERGITVCPPRLARGADYFRSTAKGDLVGTRESFLFKQPARCNEEALAKAKILTMIQLLGGITRETGVTAGEKEKFKRDAYRFFFHSSERRELEAWCDTAGYDVDYIREQATKVYENGLPAWRAEAGKGKRYEERRAYNKKQKNKETA